MESTSSGWLVKRDLACEQIAFARQYTNSLLADIAEREWFVIPPGSSSHIAWQVGHLAMAQYGLTLMRIRGKLPEDAAFIDNDFMRTFKKSSVPSPDPAVYPALDAIRHTYQEVFRRSLEAIAGYSQEQLLETVEMPYAVYPNKLGSLLFCSAHEMVHAGQIGLLRRQMGKPPVR